MALKFSETSNSSIAPVVIADCLEVNFLLIFTQAVLIGSPCFFPECMAWASAGIEPNTPSRRAIKTRVLIIVRFSLMDSLADLGQFKQQGVTSGPITLC